MVDEWAGMGQAEKVGTDLHHMPGSDVSPPRMGFPRFLKDKHTQSWRAAGKLRREEWGTARRVLAGFTINSLALPLRF